MIKFIENSETKLKFVSYPITSSISYLVILLLLIPLLYWFLSSSVINSSLTCQRTFLNRIDCQLQEKSILNSHLTKLDIINVKKVVRHSLGSRDSRIKLKANPKPPYFHINSFQKTYFYPSNPFALVLFRAFNPLNWFSISINQIELIDRFVRGKPNQKYLSVEQSLSWTDILLIGMLFFAIPILFVHNIIAWFLTAPLSTTYNFSKENQNLIVVLKRILLQNINKEYSFDMIKQVKLDIEYKTNFNKGRIILEFEPSYDYTIDEFSDSESGERNFQIIKSFVEDCKKKSK